MDTHTQQPGLQAGHARAEGIWERESALARKRISEEVALSSQLWRLHIHQPALQSKWEQAFHSHQAHVGPRQGATGSWESSASVSSAPTRGVRPRWGQRMCLGLHGLWNHVIGFIKHFLGLSFLCLYYWYWPQFLKKSLHCKPPPCTGSWERNVSRAGLGRGRPERPPYLHDCFRWERLLWGPTRFQVSSLKSCSPHFCFSLFSVFSFTGLFGPPPWEGSVGLLSGLAILWHPSHLPPNPPPPPKAGASLS